MTKSLVSVVLNKNTVVYLRNFITRVSEKVLGVWMQVIFVGLQYLDGLYTIIVNNTMHGSTNFYSQPTVAAFHCSCDKV